VVSGVLSATHHGVYAGGCSELNNWFKTVDTKEKMQINKSLRIAYNAFLLN
jgi:hypothetical protein